MNRHDRRRRAKIGNWAAMESFAGANRVISDALIQRAASATSKELFDGFCGAAQGMLISANKRDLALDLVTDEMGRLAAAVLDARGRGPITDPYEALLYFGSDKTTDRSLSVAWQKTHPDEMRPIVTQIPAIH